MADDYTNWNERFIIAIKNRSQVENMGNQICCARAQIMFDKSSNMCYFFSKPQTTKRAVENVEAYTSRIISSNVAKKYLHDIENIIGMCI